MSDPATIRPRIIDALYCEALVISDEVRNAFALSGRLDQAGLDEDMSRIAMSSEGLRTTTRMMHAIAWLLNHRAFFNGEISEFQLRNHGRLVATMRQSRQEQLEMLEPDIQALIERTRNFYDRLLRLDQDWRQPGVGPVTSVAGMIERIEQRIAR